MVIYIYLVNGNMINVTGMFNIFNFSVINVKRFILLKIVCTFYK